MSGLIVSFSFISLIVSIGVLWFVAEMTRRMSGENKCYIEERFTKHLIDMQVFEKEQKRIDIVLRDLADEVASLKMSQEHSAGKEHAITASLKEVSRQINSLESVRKKATGTDG